MDRLSILHKELFCFPLFIKNNYGMTMMTTDADKMQSYLREIEELRRKNDFKFLIGIYTCLTDADNSNNKIFADLAKKFNFSYFFTGEYYENKASLRLIDKDHYHLNKLGHSIVSEAMFKELKKNNFIDLQ
jgi:lysophospholipase L1-like esterase